MSAATITVIILAVVLVAVVIALLLQRRMLRRRFGDEYDRVVDEYHSRPAAERELRNRQRQHSKLKLRTLPDAARTRYATAWQNIQSQFIDDPRGAVTEADARFTDLLSDIGFPTSGYDEQLSTLSVEHANVLKHYREAHDIAVNVESASTEQLRQALVHYRVLFAELIGKEHFAEDPTLAHAPTPGIGMPGGTGSPVPDRPEGTATLEDGTRDSRRTS